MSRILIIHPAFLGDTLFLGPGIRALKARWPDSTVAACVGQRGVSIARLLPGCDEVIPYDKRHRDRGLVGLLRIGKRLRKFHPDIALVSHPSLRSGLLGWLSGAPRRIGYAPLCGERLKLDRDQPFPMRLLRCASQLGAGGDLSLKLHPPAHSLPVEIDAALKGLSRPLIGLVPGAERETKQWGVRKFAELARSAIQRGASVVLLGGPSERALALEIQTAAKERLFDSTGNTIDEALTILAMCTAVVGGDTGLVHCARALGRRTVVLFGPTPHTRHLFGPDERAVHLSLECQPCHASGPRRCPLGHHRCMTDLAVDQVFYALRQLCPELEGAAGRRHGSPRPG